MAASYSRNQEAGIEPRFCPRCKTGRLDDFDRVRRARWVKYLLFFLPLRRYMCYKCNRKVYVWES